jgi:hypothetical protein
VPRFQSPPRRTQRADFPHCALPFASLQGLWDLSGWGRFQSVASHSIAVEQPESVVQPRPIPHIGDHGGRIANTAGDSVLAEWGVEPTPCLGHVFYDEVAREVLFEQQLVFERVV